MLSAEILLTFAVDVLINFLVPRPEIIQSVAPLDFTKPQINEMLEMRNGDGGKALIQRVLRQHVRSKIGASFDTPFFLRPKKSRRALWFLHLSRHMAARDVMIQKHWEAKNTIEHYGPGDIEILGWDNLNTHSLPSLFDFSEIASETIRQQLPCSLMQKVDGLASESPVTLDALRFKIANDTAARFSDIDATLVQLHRAKEIEIYSADNKLRSAAVRILRPTDLISIPSQRIIPGFSRLN